eukprot:jgi/Galph1/3199/GphlegSOOS_G1838.1
MMRSIVTWRGSLKHTLHIIQHNYSLSRTKLPVVHKLLGKDVEPTTGVAKWTEKRYFFQRAAILDDHEENNSPAELPAIPLFRRPLFPGVVAPVTVSDPTACEAFINLFRSGFRYVGLFLHRNAGEIGSPWSEDGRKSSSATDWRTFSEQEETHMTGKSDDKSDYSSSKDSNRHPLFTNPSELYRVGVLAELFRVIPRPTGIELTFLCHHRIRWTSVAKIKPILYLNTEPIQEEPVNIHDPQVRAYALAIVETLKEIMNTGSLYKEQLQLLLESVDVNNPYQLADLGASLTSADPQSLQEVLEAVRLEERLTKTLNLLKTELETARVQQKINKQIEENVSNAQRRYFLTEQLKYIKKELGLEKDEKETLLTKFRERIENKNIPKQAKSVIEEEISKISLLEPSSSEYSVTRNYLDWLTSLPWDVMTVDKLDLQHAERILDEDHYGLKDVKQRILEFMAVGKRKKSIQGKIILFSGPPGVGKTSVGKSIARALGRNFYRFSVGGMNDVSEIKGHRRTYVGAMPGKLIQALKVTGSSNPLIMIDEIDKLGSGFQGSPADALLEVLDREQNSSFLDHYLDVPYDLSQVLFICTANLTEDIPLPLLDRMEHIELPGYILDEKVAIAKKYLVPKSRKDSGLKASDVVIRDSTLRTLAEQYCREPGVRDLRNKIDAIYRKAALKLAKETSGKVVISHTDLPEYVGIPRFTDWHIYEKTPPGVAIGLSYTRLGGSLLYIEAIDTGSGKGTLKTTGRLGQVMTESTDIAYSFAKSLLKQVQPANRFFETASIHLHFPEGASSKEGPSAGCAIVTTLLSLAMNIPVRDRLAMTGEITLTGKVLAIGGIREKVMAARQGNIKTVILPEANRGDWEKLDDYVKNGMEGIFVKEYPQIFQIAFPQVRVERKVLGRKVTMSNTEASMTSSKTSVIIGSRFWGVTEQEYVSLCSFIQQVLDYADRLIVLIRKDKDEVDSYRRIVEQYKPLIETNQLIVLTMTQEYTLTSGLHYLLYTALECIKDMKGPNNLFPVLLFQSIEIRSQQAISCLLNAMDENTLCVGCALPGEHKDLKSFVCEETIARDWNTLDTLVIPMATVRLSGLTCPWNTLCLWNMKQLQLIGFPIVADCVEPPGMEEAAAILIQQKLFGFCRRQVKLLYLPESCIHTRRMHGYSEARIKAHQRKLETKEIRVLQMMEALQIDTAWVTLCSHRPQVARVESIRNVYE